MKHRKKLIFGLAVILCVSLAGCNEPSAPQAGGSADPTPPASAAPAVSPTPSEAPSAGPAASPPADTPSPDPAPTDIPEQGQTATLYIGTRAAGFAEYPISYEGELTPELLIQGIADLTGWDLTLAESVYTGKGGMSVCLSSQSALFMGPPEPQKDEFHMYSAEQLAQTILDSIQKTLQKGFTGELGDPDLLDVYYFMEGEKPLELPDLGLSWPMDQPYQWHDPAGQ